jgi:transcriptional regulator with PAS, ATPase and Fis domain
MNTRCVDPLDPPVRTLEDLARDEAKIVAEFRRQAPRGKAEGIRRRPDITDEMVSAALKKHRGSLKMAAAELGVSHVTIWNRKRAMGAA